MVLFLFISQAWGTGSERAIYRFQSGDDGATPYAALLAGPGGTWYGTTFSGGGSSACGELHKRPVGCGTVFELTPVDGGSSYTETVLYAFQDGLDGGEPQGQLAMDKSGNLYGSATRGGANEYGVIFELSPAAGGTWTETTLYSFTTSDDGNFPVDLIIDQNGNLYGENPGYPETNGSVFEVSPPAESGGAWTFTTLYTFVGPDNNDGIAPTGGLAMDYDGNLFGTTWLGGSGKCNNTTGCGTIFELEHPAAPGDPWKEHILYNFQGGSDGNFPFGGVTMAEGGKNFFGTTSAGGITSGTAFEFSNTGSGWVKTVLHDFNFQTEGFLPETRVVLDKSGNLYGTTAQSGIGDGSGIVYELSPAQDGSWTETILNSLPDGSYNPSAVVLSAYDAALFGTVPSGGGRSGEWGYAFKVRLQ
jgi:uncharacterized repeat protein (TIGR03803 family)